MPTVQSGPLPVLVGAAVALGALLGALSATVGLSSTGWLCGLGTALVIGVTLSIAIRRVGTGVGPADRVTLTRAVLVCGVAALVVSRPDGAGRVVLVALTVLALVLDTVDGRVARRTGTASELGARFDLEVDALLILVLSVEASRTVGGWVLAIGAARYVFVGARGVLPWMRATLPPRYWCKVVAAVQGVVLTVVSARVLPLTVATAAAAVALILLVESFGREVWWLWQRRPARDRRRWVAGRPASLLAGLLVWAVLVVPDVGTHPSVAMLAHVPVEAIALAAVAVVLPGGARRVVAVIIGVLLALLALLHLLDVGFGLALGRPFEPLIDWTYADSVRGLLEQSTGRGWAIALLSGVGLGVVLLLVLLPLAVGRLARVAARRRRAALVVAVALAVVWAGAATAGLETAPGVPVASAGATHVAVQHVRRLGASLGDGRRFAASAAHDPLRSVPPDDLLTALRGKDVLFVFVESYGRVALEGPESASVRSALDDGTVSLRAGGYAARSGFLTSPTFGGLSWLAHSTLQSGLWVDDQRRYDALMRTDRMTLSHAFDRAGWRTVADVPSNTGPWPQGASFYGYDRVYGGDDVGYAGPSFSYAAMPDQYTLAAFQRLELDRPGRPPVMAEIDLVSSHTPWAPLPRLLPWDAVGDGSVFDAMPGEGRSPGDVWRTVESIRQAYRRSIVYSVDALVSFLRQCADRDLVVIALGDHQPATVVSGVRASHDVPVTVIARDPTVVRRIAGWGWDPGLRPSSGAPVWPMDAFRDRFLAAYG